MSEEKVKFPQLSRENVKCLVDDLPITPVEFTGTFNKMRPVSITVGEKTIDFEMCEDCYQAFMAALYEAGFFSEGNRP